MMKYTLLLLLAGFSFSADAQKLGTYTDTANHFSIGIPEGWRHESPNESTIKLSVVRPADKGDKLVENYNINVIPRANLSLEITYGRFFRAVSGTGNFNLVDSGSATIQGKNFKWLIEKHKIDPAQPIELLNYVFVAYQNSKTYILTLVTTPAAFEKYKPLLKKIADSLTL